MTSITADAGCALDRADCGLYPGDDSQIKELSLTQEWALAAAIAAVPIVIFCAVEIVFVMRRRRFEALARRSKAPRRPAAASDRSRRTG